MKEKLAFLAVMALSAAVASADRIDAGSPSDLTWSGATSGGGPESGHLVEDFEGFPTGALPINGWTGFSDNHAIVDTNTIQGMRSWRQTSLGDTFADSSSSPTVASEFGIMASMVRIDITAGPNLFQWNTIAPTNTFNTRLNFETDGTISALQVVDGAGVFFPTTGTWSSGETFQIAVETTPAGVLNVYKDAALIFSGVEINFALTGTAQGSNRWGGFIVNEAGSTGNTMTLDQFSGELIPEPSSLALLALGGLAALRRRRA